MKTPLTSLLPFLVCATPLAAAAAPGTTPTPGTASPTQLESAMFTPQTRSAGMPIIVLKGQSLRSVARITISDRVGEESELQFRGRSSFPRLSLHVSLNDDAPGTYRLRAYGRTGTLLDEMDFTIPGAASAVKSTAITQVDLLETCTGTRCTVVVTCPPGSTVVGGGYEQAGYYETKILHSRPQGTNAWSVMVEALNSKAYWTVAKGYAVCMNTK